MSEILPKTLYLGDYNAALDIDWLQKKGITHIVNATKEIPNLYPDRFQYLKLNLDDHSEEDISRALPQSFEYIHRSISQGGKVLVHCYAGISRSSSMVIYYLMRKYKMPFEKAYVHVKNLRPIINPNPGFQTQLIRTSPNSKWWNQLFA